MCGIVGVLASDGATVDFTRLRLATQSLSHRGPDDTRYLLADSNTGEVRIISDHEGPRLSLHEGIAGRFNVGIGFTRLAIIALGEPGAQPICSSDQSTWSVCNGEIYNYRELKAQLAQAGYLFHSESDTEVFLATIMTWGHHALRLIEGMFASVLLNLRRRTLMLTRDCFGIKPLYYASQAGSHLFASEIPALLKMGLKPAVDPTTLRDYLRLGLSDHSENTLFSGVKAVPPATLMELRIDGDRVWRQSRYWQLSGEPQVDVSFREAAARVRDMFLRNVERHLRSDATAGAMLSGGIDSSAIVAAARMLTSDETAIPTFSYDPFGSERSEKRWFEQMEASARTTGVHVSIDPNDLPFQIDGLIESQGEPVASIAVVAQRAVFNAAQANGVKVILEGQGADELLGGYSSLVAARVGALAVAGRWGDAARIVNQVRIHDRSSVLPVIRRATHLVIHDRRQGKGGLRNQPRYPKCVRMEWFATNGLEPFASALPPSGPSLRQQMLEQVQSNDLPLLLRTGDRNAMASSVENRVPFLVPEFAEYLLALPPDYLIGRDGSTKLVFREAMKGIVPPEILGRRRKVGFAEVEPSWVSSMDPWTQETIRSDAATSVPQIDLAVLRSEWAKVLRYERSAATQFGDRFDLEVWRALNFIRWVETFDVRVES